MNVSRNLNNIYNFAAYLTINGIIVDRMNISVKIAENENPRKDEPIRFDRVKFNKNATFYFPVNLRICRRSLQQFGQIRWPNARG